MQTKVKQLQRKHTALSETLGNLEANRLLEQLNDTSYRTIKLRVSAEIREIEDQLSKARSDLNGATNGKKWRNWLKAFGQEVKDLDTKSDAQKKAYIEGLVMRDFEVGVVNKDGFTPVRSWSDRALVVSCAFDGIYFNKVTRDGGTQLIGFDEWRAADQASYHRWRLETPKNRLPSCDESETSLGKGNQRASTTGTNDSASDNWAYSGVPSYFDLSEEGLAKIDPRVQFAIRVYRDADQTRTSDGRSP